MADAKKIDPFDVEALEKSLNDSATRVSTIWVSFLVFSLYLLIAATTVTHRQLFLAEPVKLPVLNIDLPLWGFFFLGPILFVIFHMYVLLQVQLLERTAAAYDEAVDQTIKVAADNARVRQRLANTLFAQIFAGSPSEREGWFGWILRVMSWITLAVAPILVILAFHIAFLPYHSHLATWTHRLLILLELGILFYFRRRQNEFDLSPLAVVVLWILLFTTFPGEPLVNLIIQGQFTSSVVCDRASINSRIDLRGIDVVDDEKLAKIARSSADRKLPADRGERTRDFSNRDFSCGTLVSADLRRVDFREARLLGANLGLAALDGASLDDARLEGVNLLGANLQSASLERAKLQGADLRGAKLEDASFGFAQLQGADFGYAQLQGALLDGAQLQGATLAFANLSGASLVEARLEGVYARGANLQGAVLNGAQLQSADLTQTQLQVTSFVQANLQGSDLQGATMSLSDLSGAYIWQAKGAECSSARVSDHKLDAALKIRQDGNEINQTSDVTPIEIAKFIERSTAGIPDKTRKYRAKESMAGLAKNLTQDDTANIELLWHNCEMNYKKTSANIFDQKRVSFLRQMICDSHENRNILARGIVRAWVVNDYSLSANLDPRFSALLARDLLSQDGRECAAIKEMDEPTKEKLRAIVARSKTGSKP